MSSARPGSHRREAEECAAGAAMETEQRRTGAKPSLMTVAAHDPTSNHEHEEQQAASDTRTHCTILNTQKTQADIINARKSRCSGHCCGAMSCDPDR